MKIVSSQIAMDSARAQREVHRREESLTIQAGRNRVEVQNSETRERVEGDVNRLRDSLGRDMNDQVEISPAALRAAEQARGELPPRAADIAGEASPVKETAAVDEASASKPRLEPRLQILANILEKLTGRKVVLFDTDKLTVKTDNADIEAAAQSAGASGEAGAVPLDERFGVAYSLREIRAEFEATSFEARGIVRTADGREINIDVALNLSRSFVEMNAIDVEMGNVRLKDPLVINLDTHSASLEETRFRFDIDASGEPSSIARLAESSGYLALDRNGDGVINDGSELFGALSGDGFADLAKYDDDGNGWIDRGDAVFEQLRVWVGAGGENERLYTLEELNIGAIYLGNASTDFSLKDSENEMLGMLRATGVFLYESGDVGTVQQIDLAV